MAIVGVIVKFDLPNLKGFSIIRAKVDGDKLIPISILSGNWTGYRFRKLTDRLRILKRLMWNDITVFNLKVMVHYRLTESGLKPYLSGQKVLLIDSQDKWDRVIDKEAIADLLVEDED